MATFANLANMPETIRTASGLAGLIGVAYPTGNDSNGARWLRSLRNEAISEAHRLWSPSNPSGEHHDTLADELAEIDVAVYSSNWRWSIVAELGLYAEIGPARLAILAETYGRAMTVDRMIIRLLEQAARNTYRAVWLATGSGDGS